MSDSVVSTWLCPGYSRIPGLFPDSLAIYGWLLESRAIPLICIGFHWFVVFVWFCLLNMCVFNILIVVTWCSHECWLIICFYAIILILIIIYVSGCFVYVMLDFVWKCVLFNANCESLMIFMCLLCMLLVVVDHMLCCWCIPVGFVIRCVLLMSLLCFICFVACSALLPRCCLYM